MLFKHLSELTDSEKEKLLNRETDIQEIINSVSFILQDIKENGDSAIIKYTKKFDKVELNPSGLEVTEEEISKAYDEVDSELMVALEIAASNIMEFHNLQLGTNLWFKELNGIILGQKITPLYKIGVYVPGGRATYPSSALMTIIPAKVAGVKEVIMCTPPQSDGTINPVTLCAADIAEVDRIFKVGGVQAIGAMAYGTETIPKVQKIVGPGNVFVTAAKMTVPVEIDFPAGPSEVLILADETANAKFIAMDMIAQAEHDPNAISVLITTSKELAKEVEIEINKQIKDAKRYDIIKKSIDSNGAILTANSIAEGINFSNEFAPEHLEIIVQNPLEVLNGIKNAGSIFIGNYAPVSAGDYASGTNHVLPTASASKIYSGLNVDHFVKKSTIQIIDKNGLDNIKDTIIKIAEAEGLEAHADAVRVRFK
ncbi:MAG TPA: histidinol dehydrogenase [Methanosarcinales archaeon]|nr:histidinol dehydrogenase [Methanosarcinales archaeon]